MNDLQLEEQVLWLVGSIKDPQKRQFTLQDLRVICEGSVAIQTVILPNKSLSKNDNNGKVRLITIQLQPTNPHCHLIQQIALAIHLRLRMQLVGFHEYKIRVQCFAGSHSKQEQVQKQINDKQRIAAALQNPQILAYLQQLIQ